MKHFLTHKALIIAMVAAGVWTTQTYALAPTPNHARLSPVAAQRRAVMPQGTTEIWNRTELYFGSARPDGSVVPEKKFQRFVDEEVTPRFPDGLTVLTGYGQFRNSAGIILKERSTAPILLYPPEMQDAGQKIEEIRTAYKTAFQQESVLRVDSMAGVSF